MADRKITPRYLVLLVTLVVLTACGGSADETNLATERSADPSTGASTTPAAPDSEAPAPGDDSTDQVNTELGDPLENPERYYGVYASPERPNRAWFVAEAKRPWYAEKAPEIPPGYLMIGAMFGDVAPWYLRSRSPTEFEQVWVGDFQSEPVQIEFELDPDGNAIALRFTNEDPVTEGRLERTRDLPEDWQ